MLTIQSISLQRGARTLFQDANLTVFPKQKVGLVGANGAGKSSLLALLLGLLHPDQGDIFAPKEIAHLAQEVPALSISALDYVKQGDKELFHIQAQLVQAEHHNDAEQMAGLHARLYDIGGYSADARAAQLLKGLGFKDDEFQQPVKAFSGGWRMRLNLAQTLMARADLLLLDEPTNHLDLEAIIWLEDYLKNYPGTIILISHDREFLDHLVDHIAYIDEYKIKLYSGNYSVFEKTRAEQLALQQAHYEKQQKQIQHAMKFVDRFRYKATKAKQAQSRLKAIEKLELIQSVQQHSPFQFEFLPCGKAPYPLISLKNIQINYGERIIFKDLNLSFAPEERIGLLGENGAGKSTLIKLLAGDLTPVQGEFFKAAGIKLGYYHQHQLESLDLNESPLLHLKRLDPNASEQKLRNFLGGFNFQGNMALEPITYFSGGEKARLALALLIWQAPNVLLLDEPTNHLDMEMREALTLALQNYEGTLIMISHDRHLLNTTVDEFLLVENQRVSKFSGDLIDYQQHLLKRQKTPTELNPPSAGKTVINPKKPDVSSKIKKLEKDLDKLQASLQLIDDELAEADLYQDINKQKLEEKIKKRAIIREQIEKTEQEWLNLQV